MDGRPMIVAPTPFDPVRYKETTAEQWQSAAEAWNRWGSTIDRWLGPATTLLLDITNTGPGNRVLDIASGYGEPALSAAALVGPAGSVLATDISSNLLEFAKQRASERGLENFDTRVMDGENLDLGDDMFDAVLSRVGLIYFPDQQRALSEMRRVLKPGGRVGAIVYSTPERNRFFSIPVGIIRRRAQLPAPAPGQPGPFSLGGAGVIEEAYQRAGFTDIEVKVVDAPLVMSSAAECVRFERESFGALHQMLSGLTEAEQSSVWEEIEAELQQFETDDGFAAPCELIVAAASTT